MTGCKCAECESLRPHPTPATRRLVTTVRSSIVHERDRLQERADHLERELAIAAAKRRHYVELTCARCKTSLTISSTMAVADGSMCAAMGVMAVHERWSLSRHTAEQLGMRAVTVTTDRDLCSPCATLLMQPDRASV